MIQTRMWADPRGAYAILALLSLAVLGAAIAPGGLRRRRGRTTRVVAAALLATASLALLWPQLAHRPALDVHPAVPEVAQLARTWSDGHTVPWSVVTYHGRYRLALRPANGDSVSWEGRLVFAKAAP